MQRDVALSIAFFPLILIMAALYVNGDPPLFGSFRAHWIPEMLAFAVLGTLMKRKHVAWQRMIGLYLILILAGLLMSWDLYAWSAIPFSILIMLPFPISYLIVKKKEG